MGKIVQIVFYITLLLVAMYSISSPPTKSASFTIGNDIEYRSISFPTKNQILHSIKVPNAKFAKRFSFTALNSPFARSKTLSFRELLEANSGEHIVAAINASFMQTNSAYPGRLRGPILKNKQLEEVSTKSARWPSITYRPGGQLSMDYVDIKASFQLFESTIYDVEFNTVPEDDSVSLWMDVQRVSQPTKHCPGLYSLLDVGENPVSLTLPAEKRFSTYLRPFDLNPIVAKAWALCAGETLRQKIEEQFALAKPVPIEIQISVEFEDAFGECSKSPKSTETFSEGFILGAGRALLYQDDQSNAVVAISKTPNIALESGRARTAICWNETDTYLLAAEGTKLTYSSLGKQAVIGDSHLGFSPLEIAELAQEVLSCKCAILLDGGGSTGMYYSMINESAGMRVEDGVLAVEPSDSINSAIALTLSKERPTESQ